MEFLIFPVKENAVEEFRKIYSALIGANRPEYANFLFKYVKLIEVNEESPYVEIEIPEKLKKQNGDGE